MIHFDKIKPASRLEILLAKWFGKKYTGYDSGYATTVSYWRGKWYVIECKQVGGLTMCKYNRRAMDLSPGFVVFLIVCLFACGYALGALNEHDRVIEKLEQCETDSQCEAVWNELKGD